MFAEISFQVLAERGGIARYFAVLECMPNGNMLVEKKSFACGRVNRRTVGVLVLTLVLLTLGVLLEVFLEIASKRSGVAGNFAMLTSIPDCDMFSGLSGGKR